MTNLLTLRNLRAGIQIWYTTTWPRDFHNDFYQVLHRRREHGLNNGWWVATVEDLWRWKAIRPLTKGAVLARGQAKLHHLQREYARIQSILSNRTQSLSNLSWEQVADLYNIAYGIKSVDSPVFGSKLCHFIMPDAFPVIDSNIRKKYKQINGAAPRSYEDFWKFCKSQWVTCTAQAQLVQMMRKAIGPKIFIHYPYAVKITELCIMGNPFVSVPTKR